MSPNSLHNPPVVVEDTSTQDTNVISPATVVHSNDHGIWPFVGLVLLEVLLVTIVGSGLYFMQQRADSTQTSGLNSLSVRTNKLASESQQAITAYKKSTAQSASILQNLTLDTLNVSGKSTLNQVEATSIQANSITANTINGQPFPGTSSTVSSGGSVTQFSGSYVASIGSLVGLTTAGNSGSGSRPDLSVVYGSTAYTAAQGSNQITVAGGDGLTGGGTITLGNGGTTSLSVAYGATPSTAVQGSVQLTCPGGAIGGNVSGGGNVITLGNGGNCGNLSVVNNPTFSGLVTASSNTTGLTLTGSPSASGGNTALLQIGLPISNGNSSINGGTYIGINEPSSGNSGSDADFLNFQNNGSPELSVNSSGDLSLAGTATFQNADNSTTAFKIQASGSNGAIVFDADTQDDAVGIGGPAGDYTLNVGGNINAASALYVGGNQVCISTGCYGISGGGGSGPPSINNTSSLQSNANFFISSSSVSTPTAQIEALSGQSTNLLQVVAPNGTTILDFIDPNGNLSVQKATVNGTLSINGHVITGNGSGTTSVTVGAASQTGTGATATINGDDSAGTITIHTGTTSGNLDAGDIADVTFASSYGVAPHIVITPDNSDSAALGYYQQAAVTGDGFSIYSRTAPYPGDEYVFDYIIEQ